MNRKWIVSLAGCAWVAVGFTFSTASAAASTDLPETQVITTVKDAPFYAQMSEETPTGAVSSFQTLKVKETVGDGKVVWYKVETWLGEQWMPRKDGVVVLGKIDSMDYNAHTLNVERIYDSPYSMEQELMTLPPQAVHITGHYDRWYRFNTEDGKVWWLYSPLLQEEIREESADFDMLLTRDEQLYEIPYLTKAPMTLAPQTVHVLAQWDTGIEGYRFREIVWYKIQTDQGPLWVQPKGEKAGVKPVHEFIVLPTGGYGTTAPELDDQLIWFEAGSKLEAWARWGDWFQIKTGTAKNVWVNPSWSLHKRPLGTAASSEIMHFNEETAAYNYPSPEAVVHPKGYYAPQEVQSIAKWSGDDILDWYLFRGSDGDLWVPKPRNATDRSLVGSWRLYQSQQGEAARDPQKAPLEITLTKYSQRHSFYQDESIPFTLQVRNISAQTLTVSPTEFEIEIFKLGGGPGEALKHLEKNELVWKRKLPPLSAAFPESMSSQSIFIEWDQQDTGGIPAVPGEYAMRIVPTSIHLEMGGAKETKIIDEEDIQKMIGDPVVFGIMAGHEWSGP
ncbi:hypothetical protein [Paenibacillus planticolens]|uniref:Uncharacterized protein n=1 Tax=Paenibacillus planticolens TaxID=2654976 RepID=A0ABX1ZIF2_9BACL|nr:hypothetical protein [Paenibacillus planticolens]NOU98533.1 hypothetical protein [Paenibacillus planticolens]